MNLQQKVFAALSSLNLPVVKYVNDYNGNYPVLVYQEISNVPNSHADNKEWTRRVIFQISIGTEDDEYFEIEESVTNLMIDLGFMRTDSHDIFDGVFWRVIRFSIVEVIKNE